MKFTNKYNLPQAVFDVLSNDGYKAGKDDFSATSLLKSPRQLQLYRRHFSDIEEDVSDRVWSLLGQAAHGILEKHGDDTSLVEERLYTTIFDRVLSGQVDHYHEGCVTDYKVTSVWTVMRDTKIHDWTEQLNIYAHIFRKNDFPIKRLQIVAILRDWSETEKLRYKDYPASPIMVIPITVWEENKCEQFVHTKMGKHIAAEKLPDDELPPCSEKDTWQAPNVYAVMKEGRKTAIKLHDTLEAAQDHACQLTDEGGNHIYIQTRLGTCRNCERYCSVASFCNQWKDFQRRKLEDGD